MLTSYTNINHIIRDRLKVNMSIVGAYIYAPTLRLIMGFRRLDQYVRSYKDSCTSRFLLNFWIRSVFDHQSLEQGRRTSLIVNAG